MVLRYNELLVIGDFLGGTRWAYDVACLSGIEQRTWERLQSGTKPIDHWAAQVLAPLVADRFKDISDGGTLKNQGWSDEFHAMGMGEL